jgi:hypothetical protein
MRLVLAALFASGALATHAAEHDLYLCEPHLPMGMVGVLQVGRALNAEASRRKVRVLERKVVLSKGRWEAALAGWRAQRQVAVAVQPPLQQHTALDLRHGERVSRSRSSGRCHHGERAERALFADEGDLQLQGPTLAGSDRPAAGASRTAVVAVAVLRHRWRQGRRRADRPRGTGSTRGRAGCQHRPWAIPFGAVRELSWAVAPRRTHRGCAAGLAGGAAAARRDVCDGRARRCQSLCLDDAQRNAQ